MSIMDSQCPQIYAWTYVYVTGWNLVVIYEEFWYQVDHKQYKYYFQ